MKGTWNLEKIRDSLSKLIFQVLQLFTITWIVKNFKNVVGNSVSSENKDSETLISLRVL